MSLNARLVDRLKLEHWALLGSRVDVATLHQAAAEVGVTQPSAARMLAAIRRLAN